MDWSVSRGDDGQARDCRDCKHGSAWPHYPDTFRVCNAPQALAVHGGPRSCAAIVRSPGGACKPEARHFQRAR